MSETIILRIINDAIESATYGLSALNTKLGTPAGASISADIAAMRVVVNLIATYTDTEVAAILVALGTPAGVSMSADIAAVKADTANIYARLGAPSGASTAADIAAIFARLGAPAGVSMSADISTANVWLSGLARLLTGVFPTGAGGVAVAAAAGAWAFSAAFVEVAAAAALNTSGYVIIGVNVEAAPAAEISEVRLYSGLGGSEVLIGSVRFFGPGFYPINSAKLAAGTRISAKSGSSGAGAHSSTISLVYAYVAA